MSAAKEFLLSSIGQKYLDAVDKDARKALDAMKSNLSAMSQYPSGLVSEYKGDGAQLDKAWGEFNAEASRLACGKADKPAKMVAAYSRYVLSLEVLETQNVRFGAFIAVDYAKAVELVLAIFQLAFLFQKKAFATLVAELQQLEKQLEKAKKEVTEAKAQAALNLALTAVTLCLGPAGWAARAGIAAASFTAHMIIDASLGPSRGSAVGTFNQASGDIIGIPQKIKAPWAKLGGAASGVVTLGLDFSEIGDAKDIVAKVQKRIGFVVDLAKKAEAEVIANAAKLAKLKASWESALKTAESKANNFKSRKGERTKLLKELKKLE